MDHYDHPTNLAPAIGDPTRQAVSTIRGYIYQIWRTVHAWLELIGEDRLYLEGAEDFDAVTPSSVTTVQIKDTAANITLRSPDVVDAIKNYWNTRSSNSDRKIRFRYLTRSSIGIEKDQPFGPNQAGIKLWNACRDNPDLVEALRKFLITDNKFDGTLKEFLERATSQELLEDLFTPLHWETEAPNSAAVEDAVKRKLILHGETHHIPPDSSEAVISRLLKTVAAIVSRDDITDRVLDRVDFLRIFQEETTSRIPKGELAALQSIAISVLQGILPAKDTPLSIQFTSIQGVTPPLPKSFLHRKALVDELQINLDRHGISILRGASGMGKSTLAKLIALQKEVNWLWVSLSGNTGAEIKSILHQLAQSLEGNRCVAGIVLDDMSLSPTDIRVYESHLRGLLYTLRERSVRIVLTTHDTCPPRTMESLGITVGAIYNIIGLSQADVTQFALQLGCPSHSHASQWATYIESWTKGHPALVHAYLLSLAQKQWPQFQLEDILNVPTDVLEEQQKARALIAAENSGERELLYRLSLIAGRFRRPHAIMIADSDPPVQFPGDAFDRLIGPWIEVVGPEQFRVSPLLANAAMQVWSEARVKYIRFRTADAFLKCGPLSTSDANEILLHGLLGKNGPALIQVSAALMSAGKEIWAVAVVSLGWLVACHTEKNIFPEDPATNFWLRMLQLRVAIETEALETKAIFEALDRETPTTGKTNIFLRYMFLMNALVYYQIPETPRKLIHLLVEYSDIEKDIKALVNAPPAFDFSKLGKRFQTEDGCSVLFFFVIARSTNFEFLDKLLDALEEISEELRERFVSGLRESPDAWVMLVDKPWLEEAASKEPNWDNSLKVLQRTSEIALKWKIPELALETARIISIIYDEHLHTPELALQALEKASAKLGISPHLLDSKATILFNGKKYEEALSVWESFLPGWLSDNSELTLRPALSCRIAAVAAALSEKWGRAAELFNLARIRAKKLGETTLATGLLADSGYCFWHQRNYSAFLEIFERLPTEFEALPDPNSDLKSFAVQKLAGQILLWIWAQIDSQNISNVAKPVPGMCSDLEPNPGLRNFLGTPIDMFWYMLSEIETKYSKERRIFQKVGERLRASNVPVVRYKFARLGVDEAFDSNEFGELPRLGWDLAQAEADVRACKSLGINPLLPGFSRSNESPQYPTQINLSIGPELFVAALINLIATGRGDMACFDLWSQFTESPSIQRTVSVVIDIWKTSATDSRTLLTDATSSSEQRTVAALRTIHNTSVPPDELFYSHCTLVFGLFGTPWNNYIHEPLSYLISEQWRSQTQLRFALRDPKITVPAIEIACRETVPGKQKCARILLAASAAVSVRIDQDSRVALETLAKYEST